MRKLIAASAFLLCAMPASAQMIVLGTGLSRSCYDAALLSKQVSRTDIETCTKALQQSTLTREKRIATLVNRGILYMRNGNYDTAMEDYDLALSFDEAKGTAYINKGAALIFKGEYDAALIALNRAIELDAEDLHAAYYNRSLVYEQKNDLTAAYYDLKKALELKPEWDLATHQLSRYTVEETS